MKIRKLEKGESLLIGIFTLVSANVFRISLGVFTKDTTASSAGAFPFLLGVLMLLMSILMILELRKYEKNDYGNDNYIEKMKESLRFIFPNKTIIVILLVVIYAIALPKIGFVISTLLYLSATMVMLNPKKVLTSIITSVGIVVFILLVFQTVFKVVLP